MNIKKKIINKKFVKNLFYKTTQKINQKKFYNGINNIKNK